MKTSDYAKWVIKYVYPISARFGTEVEGIKNIPKKGMVIFYSNHGGWMTFDTIFCGSIMTKAIGEHVSPFAHSFLFKIPGFGAFLKNVGALNNNKIDDIDSLKSHGRLFFVAPEGADGTTKPFREAYKLRPFRPGFVRLAIKLRAKLVPITVIGNEDLFPVVYRTEIFKKIIGAPLGIPFTFFPLPISKIKGRIYRPIDMSSYDPSLANNRRFCVELAEKLRQDLQRRLDKHASRQPLFIFNKVVQKLQKRENSICC